jgi:TM2 domain-containing membrane protein YozV
MVKVMWGVFTTLLVFCWVILFAALVLLENTSGLYEFVFKGLVSMTALWILSTLVVWGRPARQN